MRWLLPCQNTCNKKKKGRCYFYGQYFIWHGLWLCMRLILTFCIMIHVYFCVDACMHICLYSQSFACCVSTPINDPSCRYTTHEWPKLPCNEFYLVILHSQCQCLELKCITVWDVCFISSSMQINTMMTKLLAIYYRLYATKTLCLTMLFINHGA